jgi:lysozyme family protein
LKFNYISSLAETLEYEGGYSNHPKDPGGKTNYGVIQRVYNSYRRLKGNPPQDVRKITKAEVNDIYKTNYWDMVAGDLLPSGLDLAVFDFGVNSGPSQAIKNLQRAINKVEKRTLKVDGVLGPATIDAATSLSDVPGVITYFCDQRLSFLKRLKGWVTFGVTPQGKEQGWPKRVRGIKAKALQLAQQTTPSVAIPEKPVTPIELGGDPPKQSNVPEWLTGLSGVAATGLLAVVNNPYALTFALVVFCTAALFVYRKYAR